MKTVLKILLLLSFCAEVTLQAISFSTRGRQPSKIEAPVAETKTTEMPTRAVSTPVVPQALPEPVTPAVTPRPSSATGLTGEQVAAIEQQIELDKERLAELENEQAKHAARESKFIESARRDVETAAQRKTLDAASQQLVVAAGLGESTPAVQQFFLAEIVPLGLNKAHQRNPNYWRALSALDLLHITVNYAKEQYPLVVEWKLLGDNSSVKPRGDMLYSAESPRFNYFATKQEAEQAYKNEFNRLVASNQIYKDAELRMPLYGTEGLLEAFLIDFIKNSDVRKPGVRSQDYINELQNQSHNLAWLGGRSIVFTQEPVPGSGGQVRIQQVMRGESATDSLTSLAEEFVPNAVKYYVGKESLRELNTSYAAAFMRALTFGVYESTFWTFSWTENGVNARAISAAITLFNWAQYKVTNPSK